ncbi:MAG: hypothetical protein ACRDWG_07820 [Actinomycetes bacterium]
MTDRHQVPVPPRYARVNAWVISRDTDAEVRFLTSVFGAVCGGCTRAQQALAYVQATLREELQAASAGQS